MGAIIEPVNQVTSKLTHFNLIREVGKLDRRAFTDAIQEFIRYVDKAGEGATKPGLAYVNFTRMVYAPLGLNKEQREARLNGDDCGRDLFDDVQLTYIQTLERTATDVLIRGMKARMARRDIKDLVKAQVWKLGDAYKSLMKIGGGK